MNRRQLALLVGVGAIGLAAPALAADAPPTTWDGLVRVPSKKLKLVYLAPGADFRDYTKVMLDPTQVAFDKKWLRSYNDEASFGNRITGYDISNDIKQGVKSAADIFQKAFTDGGYPVVTAAGPDVLEVLTGILNIQVAAPNPLTATGQTFSTSSAAGAATFFIEVRDSQSGELLGRAVDSRLAGDNSELVRTTVTNWSDFRDLVKKWAGICVAGLNELKAQSPVPAGAATPAQGH